MDEKKVLTINIPGFSSIIGFDGAVVIGPQEDPPQCGEETIESLADYLRVIKKDFNPYCFDIEWIYRGQSDFDWHLLPQAGRKFPIRRTPDDAVKPFPDLELFYEWRKRAVEFVPDLPENDLECLAFAQHYGLATRLLDWSSNPLVALYFAAESLPERDGAIFLFSPPMQFSHGSQKEQVSLTNLGFDGVMEYVPPPFDRRILAQSARFTFHPDPAIPLTEKIHGPLMVPTITRLVRIKIPKEVKHSLCRELHAVGMNRLTLFPDVEGLSRLMNWQAV